MPKALAGTSVAAVWIINAFPPMRIEVLFSGVKCVWLQVSDKEMRG